MSMRSYSDTELDAFSRRLRQMLLSEAGMDIPANTIREQIKPALAILSPDQKDRLYMRCIKNMRLEDISRETKASKSSIHEAIQRAIRHLAVIYTQHLNHAPQRQGDKDTETPVILLNLQSWKDYSSLRAGGYDTVEQLEAAHYGALSKTLSAGGLARVMSAYIESKYMDPISTLYREYRQQNPASLPEAIMCVLIARGKQAGHTLDSVKAKIPILCSQAGLSQEELDIIKYRLNEKKSIKETARLTGETETFVKPAIERSVYAIALVLCPDLPPYKPSRRPTAHRARRRDKPAKPFDFPFEMRMTAFLIRDECKKRGRFLSLSTVRAHTQRLFQQLPHNREKWAVFARNEENCTFEVISNILGCHYHTAKAAYERGMAYLVDNMLLVSEQPGVDTSDVFDCLCMNAPAALYAIFTSKGMDNIDPAHALDVFRAVKYSLKNNEYLAISAGMIDREQRLALLKRFPNLDEDGLCALFREKVAWIAARIMLIGDYPVPMIDELNLPSKLCAAIHYHGIHSIQELKDASPAILEQVSSRDVRKAMEIMSAAHAYAGLQALVTPA